MAKKEIASVAIRVYPSSHRMLNHLADANDMTIAEVVKHLARIITINK